MRAGQVFFKDVYAGVLQEQPDGWVTFTYDDRFTGVIGCSLPRTTNVFKGSGPGQLHPFFQHLAPEGWLRATQARRAELSAEDDFGLLLAYGRDCIGAVSIQAEAKIVLPEGTGLTPETGAVSAERTVSGIQPKLLACAQDEKFYPATENSRADYIAKFSPDGIPDMILNEDISLRALRVLLGEKKPGDQVTQASRQILQGLEKPVFVVKRFDRTDANQKLRMEDFAQILGKPRGFGFEGKYNADFIEVIDAIRTFSAIPEIDVFLFFQRLVAFVILGNCDCHLKNWSLLESPFGLRLSPVYDVVSSIPYAATHQVTTRFGLAINGRQFMWAEIDRSVLEKFGHDIGLKHGIIQREIDNQIGKMNKVLKIIDAQGAIGQSSEGLRAAYNAAVIESCERIKA